MKIVLDTNVLLMSMPKVSYYRPIFNALLNGEYTLAISEDILQEYVEIIGRKTTGQIGHNVGELLMKLVNVEKREVYFRWNLIHADPDDNKFVDCAVAAGAQFIVSNDRHFKELEGVEFPPFTAINANQLLALL